MIMIIIFGSILALGAAILVFWLAWQIIKFWRKIREEALVHFSFMFIYCGALITGMVFLAIIVFIVRPQVITFRNFVLTYGAFYDFFYLEFSFFYLALFSNSRRFIEKYLPLLIGGALTMNLIIPLAQSNNLDVLTLVMHGIAILAGLFLIIQLYIRIKNNKQYFPPEEQEFINLLEKITLGFFLVSFPDGIGFLILVFVQFEITQAFYILFVGIAVISSIVAYYLVDLLTKKGKKVDFTHFFNTIS